jgi:predicted dehydrogenase
MMKKRKLRMGMVGGGLDAFIGSVHRMAANLDGQVELVCGAFSINPEISKQSGEAFFIDPNRVYSTYQEMIEKESKLPEDQRMDFVTIVTPNFVHFDPAKMALENGFNVVIEKPMTFDLPEAIALKKLVEETGLTLALTHTYSGYPMIKEAKSMIKAGKLGKVRKIIVEYPQGWLSRLSEREGNAQAAWRTDPSKSGKSGAMGDIGTHAAHLAEYVSGLKISELCADLHTMVPGRLLDDDGNVLLRFDNGANGVLIASQIAAGDENSLAIRIYGENGGLEWKQEEPNSLIVKMLDEPKQIFRTGNNYKEAYELSSFAKHNTRIPSGHPEGLLEAFANIYRNFVSTVSAKLAGEEPTAEMLDFPQVDEGVRGMAFIDKVVESNASSEKWTAFEY